MTERPAWAPECTCGETPQGYFCHECRAWAGSSHGDQASWSRPRLTEADRATFAKAQEAYAEQDAEALAEAMDAKRELVIEYRCANGRTPSRHPKSGERVLHCGCPLVAAPRECIDAVAAKTVTVQRRGLQH